MTNIPVSFATLTLPAGSYVLQAKLYASGTNTEFVLCEIDDTAAGLALDQAIATLGPGSPRALNFNSQSSLALLSTVTRTATTTFTVTCYPDAFFPSGYFTSSVEFVSIQLSSLVVH